jgi:hypothetical protein
MDRLVGPIADEVRVRRAQAARIKATVQGLDIRYSVTNVAGGGTPWPYDVLYCAGI